MGYIVDYDWAKKRLAGVNGFNTLVPYLTPKQMDSTLREVIADWTDHQDPDSGFGSSDMTFLLKDVIDDLVYGVNRDNGTTFATGFPNNCLAVVTK